MITGRWIAAGLERGRNVDIKEPVLSSQQGRWIRRGLRARACRTVLRTDPGTTSHPRGAVRPDRGSGRDNATPVAIGVGVAIWARRRNRLRPFNSAVNCSPSSKAMLSLANTEKSSPWSTPHGCDARSCRSVNAPATQPRHRCAEAVRSISRTTTFRERMDLRHEPTSIQYRQTGTDPSGPDTTFSKTPPQSSMTLAEPTLSASQVTSTRSRPSDDATARDWRRMPVA